LAISNLFRIFVYKQLVNLKQTKMKKVVFAAVVALTIGLTSCGNGTSKTEVATDSTAVATDSVAVDTTAAPVADSTSTK
jgi:type 1 fimbria pilin